MVQPESLAVRERIITEATRLLVVQGYDAISMREIAAAVGLSKAGLYYHFKDKEDLFAAIVASNLDALEQTIRAAHQAATTRQRVHVLIQTLLAQSVERQAVMRVSRVELARLSPPARARLADLYERKMLQPVEAILAAGIADGDLRPLPVRTLCWLLLGLLTPFIGGGSRASTPVTTADVLVSAFLDGVATPPTGSGDELA